MTGFITDDRYSAMAGVDLSASMYRFGVIRPSDGLIVLPTAAGQKVDGVISVGNTATGRRASELQTSNTGGILWGGTVAPGDPITTDSAGRGVVSTGAGQWVAGVAVDAGVINTTGNLRLAPGGAGGAGVGAAPITFSFDLATLAVDGERIADYLFGFPGRITRIAALVKVAGAGAGATVTLTPNIGGTPLTGGVLTLTLANTAAPGMVEATAITALNVFTATDVMNLVASASTAFTAGQVDLLFYVA